MNVEGRLIMAVKNAQNQIAQLEAMVITMNRAMQFTYGLLTSEQKTKVQEFLSGTKRADEKSDGRLPSNVEPGVRQDDSSGPGQDASGTGRGQDGGGSVPTSDG
jgi:hypothetical protein